MLYIGGAGMTRGYHKLPEKNAAAFKENPWPAMVELFSAADFPRPSILYNTGDLAIRDSDGIIEFRGRADSQVKINGERIELGQIEKVLETHSLVKQCVVLARSDMEPERLVLVAYVELVEGADNPGTTRALNEFSRASMPSFQVPKTIVFIQAAMWPLNPARKIDRAALPAPHTQSEQGVEQLSNSSDMSHTTPSSLISRVSMAAERVIKAEVDEDIPLFEAGLTSLSIPVFVQV